MFYSTVSSAAPGRISAWQPPYGSHKSATRSHAHRDQDSWSMKSRDKVLKVKVDAPLRKNVKSVRVQKTMNTYRYKYIILMTWLKELCLLFYKILFHIRFIITSVLFFLVWNKIKNFYSSHHHPHSPRSMASIFLPCSIIAIQSRRPMRASCVICQGDSNALFLFIYEQCPHYQHIRCMAEKILMVSSFSVKWKRSRQNKQSVFFFSRKASGCERMVKNDPSQSVCLCWVMRGMSLCVSNAAILQKSGTKSQSLCRRPWMSTRIAEDKV